MTRLETFSLDVGHRLQRRSALSVRRGRQECQRAPRPYGVELTAGAEVARSLPSVKVLPGDVLARGLPPPVAASKRTSESVASPC
jgi:hypothetical protein